MMNAQTSLKKCHEPSFDFIDDFKITACMIEQTRAQLSVIYSIKANIDSTRIHSWYADIDRLQRHPGKIGGHVLWCPQFCYRLLTNRYIGNIL